MAVVLSAGVLCYACIEDTQDVYFLLGRERCSSERNSGSNRWSYFGGRVKPGETEMECASREFVEESLGLAWLDEAGRMPSVTADVTHEALARGNYTFRVALDTRTDRPVPASPHGASVQQLRVCYVKRIPWQPELPEQFQCLRQQLEGIDVLSRDNMAAATTKFATLPREVQIHPAFELRHDHHGTLVAVTVKAEYLEKQQVGWWSLHRLRSIIRNGGSYKNKYCFRIGFLSTLAVIVEHFGIMELVGRHWMQHVAEHDESVTERDEPVTERDACVTPGQHASPPPSP